ncbi:hypothetical protein EYC57_21445 [Xanthomonas oryzae]|nr:hypothetical protein EYC57_21445 [Xanthomonas oryzae]
MICSSEKRFFTSNLLGIGNWTPNQGATQTWGDVAPGDDGDGGVQRGAPRIDRAPVAITGRCGPPLPPAPATGSRADVPLRRRP